MSWSFQNIAKIENPGQNCVKIIDKCVKNYLTKELNLTLEKIKI